MEDGKCTNSLALQVNMMKNERVVISMDYPLILLFLKYCESAKQHLEYCDDCVGLGSWSELDVSFSVSDASKRNEYSWKFRRKAATLGDLMAK